MDDVEIESVEIGEDNIVHSVVLLKSWIALAHETKKDSKDIEDLLDLILGLWCIVKTNNTKVVELENKLTSINNFMGLR